MFKGTTILAVRRDGSIAIGGDGQVTDGRPKNFHRDPLDLYVVVSGMTGVTGLLFLYFRKEGSRGRGYVPEKPGEGLGCSNIGRVCPSPSNTLYLTSLYQ